MVTRSRQIRFTLHNSSLQRTLTNNLYFSLFYWRARSDCCHDLPQIMSGKCTRIEYCSLGRVAHTSYEIYEHTDITHTSRVLERWHRRVWATCVFGWRRTTGLERCLSGLGVTKRPWGAWSPDRLTRWYGGRLGDDSAQEGGPDDTVARGRWTPPAKSGTERGVLSLCERERGRGGGAYLFLTSGRAGRI